MKKAVCPSSTSWICAARRPGGPDCERLIRDIKVISNKVHRWLVCSGRYHLSHCDVGIHIKISEPEEIITAEITKILDECPAEPLEAKQDDTYAK